MIIKWLNQFLFIGALIFLIWYLKKNIFKISFKDIQFNGTYLFISFSLLLAAQYFQAFLWHKITQDNGCNVKLRLGIYLRLKNEILKYIPGKITQFGSLLLDYDLLGASKSKVAFCIFLENVFSLLGSALLSIFLLSYFISNIWLLGLTFLILIIIIILGNKLFISTFLNLYTKIKKTSQLEYQSIKSVAKYLFLYVFVWLLFGLGFFFLVKSLTILENKHMVLIITAFSASSLLGFIAFFAPAGLGFREGSLVFFLKSILPGSILLLPIVLSRIQIVICDLILFIFGYIIKIWNQNSK